MFLSICIQNVSLKAKAKVPTHTDRTLKEKIEILAKLDCSVKAVDICKRFNISQSMLSTWKKQRGKINEMVDVGKVLYQKHNHESFLPQVERALHLWFCEMRSKLHTPPINQSLFRRLHCKYFTLSLTSPTCVTVSILHS